MEQSSIRSFIIGLLASLFTLSCCLGLKDHMKERPECLMWAKLENKTLPLQDQGHANCTTNSDCTGFTCRGIYQDRGLDFGLQVMPCTNPPGVKIFGSAPQFNAKNFSHIFVHGNDYEIPGAILNSTILPVSAVHPASANTEIKGRLEVQLKMDESNHIMKMGLFIKACINATCLYRKAVFDGTEIPVPECTNHIDQGINSGDSSEDDLTENNFCNINELYGCGENQVCVQLEPENNRGQCQCLQGFDKQDDGSCISLKEEDELIAIQHQKPLLVAKESNSIKRSSGYPDANPDPAPQVEESSTSGAIAAGVVSVLVIVLIVGGFTYMVTRTRLVPRLRAHITNKPYEDIIINDRGQTAAQAQAAASRANTQLA